MKTNKLFTLVLIGMFLGVSGNLLAWEAEFTHTCLTIDGLQLTDAHNYLHAWLDVEDGLNAELTLSDTAGAFVEDLVGRGMDLKANTRTALEWAEEGSRLEDAKLYHTRRQRHFHDPTRDAGLDNRTDYPDWWGATTLPPSFDLIGESAFYWATTGKSRTGYTKDNVATWNETRGKFYDALAGSEQSVREQSLAEMFLALGHVLHLLEDMGVPAAGWRGGFDGATTLTGSFAFCSALASEYPVGPASQTIRRIAGRSCSQILMSLSICERVTKSIAGASLSQRATCRDALWVSMPM